MISRIAGQSVAFFFAALLAISPCAIFYSRIVRPYSMVLFFGFLSLLCLILWVREGRARHLLAYALSGFAAIYFHPYAALPVGAPLAALFVLALLRRTDDREAPWISLKNLLGAGILMGVLLVLLLGPAHWQNPWWRHVLGTSRVTTSGLWEFLSLLAGTHISVSKILFAALAGYGLHAWVQKELRIGLLFLSIWAAFFLLLIFATQDGMHAAIQIARYNIILLPVAMLLAAFALDRLLARLPPAGRFAAGLLLIGGLIAGSPLWRTFALPNNFMHHSAFQDSYAPFDWSRSRVRLLTPLPLMPRERIPAFYSGVAADPSVPGIIEYPMYIGDPLNLYYFYQHFHRKPVAIGYVPDFPFPPLPSGNDFIYQTTPPDYVFSRAQTLGLGEKI
ncbi:MAG: glycosyltransferase family 39 protein, partial [Prosthecobacter sp.]|nr:glycosyltransferase family 39 protein [Prosthecobacter sp.]